MSSDEDDYMSDKFLAQGVSSTEDIRPSLIKLKRDQRQLDLYKKKIKLTEPKRAVREADQREKGLQTAISSENKGFQMLAKMGYKPGTSLGKTNEGIVEPINVVVKKDTKGVGTRKRRLVKDNKVMEVLEGDFKKSIREKMSTKDLFRNFKKAQVSCEHLDSKVGIKAPMKIYFWPKEITDLLFGKYKANQEEDDDDDDDEEEEEEAEAENEQAYRQLLTSENFESVINYLRSKHFYCIFCASAGTDEEDLNSFCPGPFQQDHDE